MIKFIEIINSDKEQNSYSVKNLLKNSNGLNNMLALFFTGFEPTLDILLDILLRWPITPEIVHIFRTLLEYIFLEYA